jgi:hypothetical protein
MVDGGSAETAARSGCDRGHTGCSAGRSRPEDRELAARAWPALRDRAESLEDDHATYYGAAWVALARVMLDTDRLGRCPAAVEPIRPADAADRWLDFATAPT